MRTGVALSIELVFGMPSSPMVMTWIFTLMTVSGLVMRDSGLLYRVEVFLSFAFKEGEELSTRTCCPIFNTGKA